MFKILVVEDDEKLNQIICTYLGSKGYETVGCMAASIALGQLKKGGFSLILSDIMMPKMDGFQFATEVRAENISIPILFMSALGDLSSKQRGYEIGIDDYIVKPFDLTELVLKVGAVLRRSQIEQSKKIEIGNLILDFEEHMAYVDDNQLQLTVREFDILYKILSYPKKTFTRAKLMEEFWDFDSSAMSRTVDVYMAKIREKTSECTGFEIVTVHGLGYKAVLK